jgi:hypothetical protein
MSSVGNIIPILILRCPRAARASKDGGELRAWGHPSRRPLRGLLRMRTGVLRSHLRMRSE